MAVISPLKSQRVFFVGNGSSAINWHRVFCGWLDFEGFLCGSSHSDI